MSELFRLYSRRPVKIKAVEVTSELLKGTTSLPEGWELFEQGYINIPTFAGTQSAFLGDYIKQDSQVMYSVISKHMFRDLY